MFFLTRINVFIISLVRTKSQGTLHINNNYTNVIKVFEDHIEFKNRIDKKHRTQKNEKFDF